MLYIPNKTSTKMPTLKKINSQAESNRERLVRVMQELTVEDSNPTPRSVLKEKSGAAVSSWSYSERKKKPKTFAL